MIRRIIVVLEGCRVLQGLAATFDLLATTENEAAEPLLMAALNSPLRAVQLAAVRAILQRRSPTGLRELVRRLHEIDESWKAVIHEQRNRMLPALRDAVLGVDRLMAQNGFQAAEWFQEYDLIPTLINALEDEANSHRDLAAATLANLADALYRDLASQRDQSRRRDPQIDRRHAVTALEASVLRFNKHQRFEPLEAFLQLVARDNAVLSRILGDPRDPSFVPLLQVMHSSERPGVIRLLIGFLEDPHPPTAGLSALFRRTDRRSLENVLRKVGAEPSPVVRANLKHVDTIAWATDFALLDQLDGAQQHGAVRTVALAGLKRADVLAFLQRLVERGKPAGRKAAAAALAQYNGADVNTLVLRAVRDDDPHVQAAGLSQLRQRGIPGALTTLIEALDSPLRPVRDAARGNLDEFSFRRFLPAFDLLEDEVRRSTGRLVKKVDLTAGVQLREEMASPQGKRRMRALQVAAAMELVDELLDAVAERAADEDHLVRLEAARALGASRLPAARATLVELTNDASFTVSEGALQAIEQFDHNAAQLVAGDEVDADAAAPGSDAPHAPLPPLAPEDFPLPLMTPEANYGG